jgi:hypothetical protein
MSRLFEISTKTPEMTNTSVAYSTLLNKHTEKIKSVEELVRKPTKGEAVYLQTDKAFNAFTFIPYVANTEQIKELSAVTYAVNRQVIDALIHLYDTGKVERINLLVSECLLKRSPLVADYLQSVCKQRTNITVLYAWTHAKVCLIETYENKYIIEGSGNWSANAHFEQYVWTNDDFVFDFRKEIFRNEKILLK